MPLADNKPVDDPNSKSPLDAVGEESVGDLETEAQALVGALVADRYRVEALLGEGAMGAVYRAEHIHMQKAVALKVLHSTTSQNPEVVRRFEREAVAAGRVEHPNVAGATDFGRLEDGSFYLVLEFIDGQSLGQLIENEAPLEVERACRITIQIAAALAAAHSAGIVHRDLKPENVMLPRNDSGTEIVKVLDFGMAKLQHADATETQLTMHGAVYGTPQYMAPEQASGEVVDHRADLYAVGLMLYEMLSGRTPFEAETMMALLIKHMTEKPPALPATIPRPLAKLVMQLLEKKPANRPQSADEVLTRLTDLLGTPYQDPRTSALGAVGPGAYRASAASMAEIKEQVADKMAPYVQRAMEASEPAVEFLKQPMTVRGVTFPRWIPAAALFGFLVVLLFAGGSDEGAQDRSASSVAAAPPSPAPQKIDAKTKDPKPPDPELAKVIAAAERGSDPALYALDQRDDDDRSLTEWMGLAKARLMRKHVKKGLDAYRAAIKMEPSMKADEVLLGAIRRVADDEQYAELVIDFVADELGSLGADMLFHIWAKTSLKTKSTTLAYEKLNSAAVRENYSPELAVAMKLRDVDAEDCEGYLKVLPEIERMGDDRSLTILRKLAKETGCGSSKRKDCYKCLRGSDNLRDAIQAAAMRKAPQFELVNFEFKL